MSDLDYRDPLDLDPHFEPPEPDYYISDRDLDAIAEREVPRGRW